ncbi:Pre-mRNA-splicing factor SPF27 [Hypoxylon fragiforme]|uniref:Pre-mRNA-splicing factor SPF27 n=1 Tax=Hypoxylon fragiforme TaxID=63214 RepID=UPI0020C710F8|nr:Pre-mRNA-splicing factor SPF27 [Hypoxylon fragiforme]KAI2606382.1 Pre-mRNA-splicing factor SPF27 [Hypoxylon fragiforme]
MSSIRTTVHESLPYVDPEPTPAERAAAESLIAAEQQSTSTSTSPSTLLPPTYTPTFTPLMTAELSRIATKAPLRAIDLSRYEATPSSPPSSPSSQKTLAPLLARAYTSSAYLSSRHTHLQLLDAYGKNAWLVGNYQLEAELQSLERDLASAKREIDVLTIERRRAQDAVAGELTALDDNWRRGVGRVLETEVATEALRLQVLEKQREGVAGGMS